MNNNKKPGSGDNRRRKMQHRLNTLKQQEKDDASQQKITQLEAALQQKDDVIATLSADELKDLDIDMKDVDDEENEDQHAPPQEENGQPIDPASGQPKDTPQDEKNKDPAPQLKEAPQDEKNKTPAPPSDGGNQDGNKNPKKQVIIDLTSDDVKESVESDDVNANNNLFDPDDSDSDSGPYEDEDGKPLYIRPGPKPSKGEEVQTVGWAQIRNYKVFINRYGKKSAARYRIEKISYPEEYEEDPPENEKVSNKNNRFGDVINPNGKYKYTKRHIVAIYGVAWMGKYDEPAKDLEIMDPNWKERGEHPWALTYVWVAWDIDGQVVKKWEPRSALRTRWGKEDADKGVYKAADEAEKRYAEAKSGQRRATSRTPSVGLAQEDVDRQRDMSLGVNRSTRSPTPTAISRSAKSTPGGSAKTRNLDIENLRVEFLCEWMELLGLDSGAKFADLPRDDKLDCLAAWKLEKAKHMVVT